MIPTYLFHLSTEAVRKKFLHTINLFEKKGRGETMFTIIFKPKENDYTNPLSTFIDSSLVLEIIFYILGLIGLHFAYILY